MRDPKRIKIILGLMEELWLQCPDQRFLQLVENIHSQTSMPMWFIEDTRFMELINQFDRKINNERE